MPDEDEMSGGNSRADEYSSARSSKFRFKSPKHRERSDRKSEDKRDTKGREARRRYGDSRSSHRRHHRRSKRSQSPVARNSSGYHEDRFAHSGTSAHLDPDAAFRESLFDALADDEGAEYWEGVYGQPMHIYPNVKEGPEGELERMTDDEYATHVRNRMWEKSHQHLIEERQRREEQRRKDKDQEEQRRKLESERADFDSLIQDALQRGNRRKTKHDWQDTWQRYTEKWDRLLEFATGDHRMSDNQSPSTMIPWPVITGNRKDISKDAVQDFFRSLPSDQLGATLKVERIRWHPDKMQQRFRGIQVEDDVMQAVTAVFQIIDSLWSDLRKDP